jgi:hypothetical protein
MERRRSSCGGFIATLMVLVGLLALGYYFVLRPLIGDFIAGQGGTQDQIEGQIEQQVPTVVGALPSGTLTISDQEVNDFIAANPEALRPLDSATLSFTPGVVTAELRALGTSSTATTGLAVDNGRIVAVNPQLSGALGAAVQADVVANALTEQINQQLAQQGRRASAISVEQGQLVITLE